MVGSAEPARPVGAADGGHGQVGHPHGVDDHRRDVQLLQLGAQRGVQVGGDEDGAVAGARAHVVEPLAGGAGPAVDRRDDDSAARAVGGVLHAADDLNGPRAVEVVEDEVEQPDLRTGTRADRLARLAAAPPVAAGAQQGLDAFAGGGSDVAPPVEDARDRRRGHARFRGDGGDGHGRGRGLGHCSSFVPAQPTSARPPRHRSGSPSGPVSAAGAGPGPDFGTAHANAPYRPRAPDQPNPVPWTAEHASGAPPTAPAARRPAPDRRRPRLPRRSAPTFRRDRTRGPAAAPASRPGPRPTRRTAPPSAPLPQAGVLTVAPGTA